MKPAPATVRRLVYLGTPWIAVPPLRALVHAGFEIPLVVTNRDKRRGRGNELMPTPVKAAAEALDIPVSHRSADVLDVEADLGVVVAFGRIIKADILNALPMVNIHFSLLPRWRGAAPVERAILAGDEVSGVCLMELAYELDSGGVYDSVEVPILADATVDGLREQMVTIASDLLVRRLQSGLGEPTPQSGEVTWARKIAPGELEADWTSSAAHISRLSRVGRAFTFLRGRRLVLHEVRPAVIAGPDSGVAELPSLEPGELALVERRVLVGTGDGTIELLRVQPEGKAAMETGAWFNGLRLDEQERLGR